MLEFLIDSIFVIFGGRVFQQTVDIPMGTNCSALLADLFLYSYEEYFIQGLLKKNEKKVAWSFNFTFRYVDDVLSLNNSRFGDFVYRIFPIELEIKDTTDTDRSVSCLYLHLEIDRLRTKLYDKRDDFNFPLNFSFICSNIPAAPVYEVYVSQLIWYSRTCGSYQDFLHRGLLLIRKLRNQGFLLVKLKSSLQKFYGCHHDLVDRYGISVSQLTTDMFHLSVNTSRSFPHSWHITGFVTRLTLRMSLVEHKLLTLPEHLSSPPVFSGVRVTRSLVLYVCFIDRYLSFCPFSFGHCVVCTSSLFGFWLLLRCLQTLLTQ